MVCWYTYLFIFGCLVCVLGVQNGDEYSIVSTAGFVCVCIDSSVGWYVEGLWLLVARAEGAEHDDSYYCDNDAVAVVIIIAGPKPEGIIRTGGGRGAINVCIYLYIYAI